MGNFQHRALMVFASVSAYTAPALMTVCLLTDYWIYGKQIRLPSNQVIKPGEAIILNFTYHRIGLWRECMKDSIDLPYTCEIVRYSKAEAKLEKGFKAVSYRSAPSMACFGVSSLLLILAIILFTRGLCKRRRKAVFFISGLLFSISGLMTMVGVTLYVSITTEESVKIEQDYPVMSCLYGYSFLCAIFSFVLQELTGVLTVYWFIYRFRALVRRQEKLRARTRQFMGNCLSMTTALQFNVATLTPLPTPIKPAVNDRSEYQINQNHHSTSNSHHSSVRRGRIPFDKSYVKKSSSSSSQRIDHVILPSAAPPVSPMLAYGDYCRVLIRAEDMDLLTQMVKSKSQAHLLSNSRPTTPAPATTTNKIIPNSHLSRPEKTNRSRHSARKSVKRTTSV